MNEYNWRNYGSLEKFDSFPIHDDIAVWLTNEYALLGKNILDVGGGTGIQLSYMHQENFRCNVDFSKEAIDFGRKNHKDLMHLNLDVSKNKLPFSDKFFDFVFSIQVLEHITEHDIGFVLSEIYRVLKPNSKLFLSVAVTENIEDKSHVTLRNRAWWIRKVEKYFTEEKKEYEGKYQWQYFFLERS